MSTQLIPTKTYMNWVNVRILPAGATQPIIIVAVLDVETNRGSKRKNFYGDNRQYPRVSKVVESERTVSITTGDTAVLSTIPVNVPCTVSATLLDPINLDAPGGGGYTLQLVNAIMENNKTGGKNNDFANGMVSFTSFGATDANGNEIDPMTTTYL